MVMGALVNKKELREKRLFLAIDEGIVEMNDLMVENRKKSEEVLKKYVSDGGLEDLEVLDALAVYSVEYDELLEMRERLMSIRKYVRETLSPTGDCGR